MTCKVCADSELSGIRNALQSALSTTWHLWVQKCSSICIKYHIALRELTQFFKFKLYAQLSTRCLPLLANEITLLQGGSQEWLEYRTH